MHNDELIVLDAGSRLQIFDLQGHFRKQLELSPGDASGLCVDSLGIIYVSRETTDIVEAYNHEGKLLKSFGGTGRRYLQVARLRGPASTDRHFRVTIGSDRELEYLGLFSVTAGSSRNQHESLLWLRSRPALSWASRLELANVRLANHFFARFHSQAAANTPGEPPKYNIWGMAV